MATRGRRRRSGLEDFVTGFANTYGAFDKISQSIEDQKMRDELKAAQEGSRQRDTETASGEDALAAGQQALQDRMATATTEEDAQRIQQEFAPTIEALKAQRATPASVVHSIGTGTGFQQRDKAFTPEEVNLNNMAAREGIYRKYGKDDLADALQRDALTRQVIGLQIDEARDKADTRAKMKEVDNKLRAWGDTNIQKDANGQPIINYGTMVNMAKMRTLLLSQRGLYDQAMQTAKDGMQFAQDKIKSDAAEREAAVRDAKLAFGMGDTTKALGVYKQFVPDGADPVALTNQADGSLILSRRSALDGAPLPPMVFKDQAHFLAVLDGVADSKSLSDYVERTFKHDIESRKVKATEKTASAAASRAAAAGTTASVMKEKEARAARNEEALAKATAEYQAAIDSGDAKRVAAAKIAVLGAGGKLEKPTMEYSVAANPMGGYLQYDKATGMGAIVSQDGKRVAIINPPNTPDPIPAGAIALLKAKPHLAAEFDAKYGAGAAKKVLGK